MNTWYERKYGEGKHSIVVKDSVVESETFENRSGRIYVGQQKLKGKKISESQLKKMGFKAA